MLVIDWSWSDLNSFMVKNKIVFSFEISYEKRKAAEDFRVDRNSTD